MPKAKAKAKTKTKAKAKTKTKAKAKTKTKAKAKTKTKAKAKSKRKPKPKVIPTCGNCKHWASPEQGEDGQCRRYPPVPQGFVNHGHAHHVKTTFKELRSIVPLTPIGFCCGEHPDA